ncbi:hypothetical protein CNR22_11070 [Sphingobacteriaceae bacterium]|nr:hypothetical protein CNR22_11070 [Sphingobacteriaceae bacterium]
MKGSQIKIWVPLLFLFAGLLCIFFSRHEPIRDFGNYYYGSRLLLDGNFSSEIYTSIHHFNEQIGSYGETNYFENYIPVPPFSALFYIPFCIFSSLKAKFVFNLVSLCLFCWSLFRLLKFLDTNSKTLYILPLILFFPLYANIQQGQTYLLIVALLFEIFYSSQKKRLFYPSFLIAVIIALKIFPGIILLYFIFKKNWRIVGLSIVMLIILTSVTSLLLPDTVTFSYFTDILPRLFNNDIVGTYHAGNQSFYTLLLHLFSYDGLANINPLINQPLFVVFFESVFFALILGFCFSMLKRSPTIFFGFVSLTGLLLSRYSTSYGMILILPVLIALLSDKKPSFLSGTIFFISLGMATIPNVFIEGFFNLPFIRLYGLLILLALILYHYRIHFNYKIFAALILPVLILKYFSLPVADVSYFSIQNTKGILYEIDIKNDSLILKSCMGDKNIFEKYPLKEKAHFSDSLFIRNNIIYYNHKVVCNDKSNKEQPFLYNNSIVFMSDLNQAVRFYKLRSVPL